MEVAKYLGGPDDKQDVPPLRVEPLQVRVVYVLQLFPVRSQLHDLDGLDIVDVLRQRLPGQQQSVGWLFVVELPHDGFESGEVELVLGLVDLLQLEVGLGGGFNVGQGCGLGEVAGFFEELGAEAQEYQHWG